MLCLGWAKGEPEAVSSIPPKAHLACAPEKGNNNLFSLEWLFSLGFWFPGQLRQSWLGLEKRRSSSVRFPGHVLESPCLVSNSCFPWALVPRPIKAAAGPWPCLPRFAKQGIRHPRGQKTLDSIQSFFPFMCVGFHSEKWRPNARASAFHTRSKDDTTQILRSQVSN
jgi:hypothetical protein